MIGWGFDPARPEKLTAALLDHHRTATLVARSRNVWGLRFVYEGPLVAPPGPTPPIRSVWEEKTGDDVARLLTAYRF